MDQLHCDYSKTIKHLSQIIKDGREQITPYLQNIGKLVTVKT